MTGAMPTLFVVDVTQAALASKPLSIIQAGNQSINQSLGTCRHSPPSEWLPSRWGPDGAKQQAGNAGLPCLPRFCASLYIPGLLRLLLVFLVPAAAGRARPIARQPCCLCGDGSPACPSSRQNRMLRQSETHTPPLLLCFPPCGPVGQSRGSPICNMWGHALRRLSGLPSVHICTYMPQLYEGHLTRLVSNSTMVSAGTFG